MKKASDILNTLQNKPQFSKLSGYGCIRKIQAAFSKPLQKMIKFSYIKNDTLFFVLNHPGAKQEFDNNIQSIKSALKFVRPKECEEFSITDIKAFVSHTPVNSTSITAKVKEPETYPERATGAFEIKTQDEKLCTLLESIRALIKEKNES